VTPPRDIQPSLHSVTRVALDAMPWLTPSDAALRSLALRLAWAIDACGTDSETLAVLVPKYQTALIHLGGTPATRRELHAEPPEDDIVTELRSA
jgi:hypothetical protein